uniref:Uncharacterized protein n=1 Tax=Panagrolaimus sp. PS1159 TaxID=55785 RepID=A0AC35F596_9BILA
MLPFSSKNECYKLSEIQKIQKYDKVVKEDECELINSTFLKLNIPNAQGYCSDNQIFNVKLGSNTTIFCKYPCSNITSVELLSRQVSNNQFCNCGKCGTVVNPRVTLNSSNHLQIDIFLQPSFYATLNFTDVNAISSNQNVCPSIVSTTIDYFIKNNTNTNIARFWLKRGRFYCPSEITCPWEIFYVFYEDDPFFRPSYLFSIKCIILGIHVAIAEKAITFYTNKLW